ncbi:MAG: cation:dicarboxylase symporter family transporter, partial [Cyanobacteria bacterium J06635_10]
MNKTEKTTEFSRLEVLLWGITISAAVVLGIFLDVEHPLIKYSTLPAFLVLRILVSLAVPMFFLVIINNLITLQFPRKTWYRLLFPLLSNTTFAIIIGFVVVNIIQPGNGADLIPFEFVEQRQPTPDFGNIDNFWDAILELIKNLVPTSLIEPLINNNVMQIIVVAFSLGIVLRAIKSEQKELDKFEVTEEDNPCPERLENFIQVLFYALKNIWDFVINLIHKIFDFATNLVQIIWNFAIELVTKISDWVKSLFNIESETNQQDEKNNDVKEDEKNNIDFQPLENVIGVLLQPLTK